jgi:glycosyltransferase involved in cell wall biosynthesis
VKIWVDGQCFQTGSNVRGIGRYVANFLRAVKQVEPDIDLVISLNGNMKEEAVAARHYLEVAVPGCEIAVWYGLTPEGELFRGYCTERMTDEHILAAHINEINPDVALSPSPFEGTVDRSNPFIKTQNVQALTACIFHDAIPYRYPEVYLKEDNARKLYFRRFEEIRNFDQVLCNSHFTEQEYREIYDQTNAVTIGAGLSESFQKLVEEWSYDANSMAAQLGQYALYVGGMDWRKNVPYLVRAMGRLAECMAGQFKLVLAGDNGEEFVGPIRDMWVARDLDPANLISTGWIPDYTLVDLYKNATVVVQPSRMEGFGLGALEAIACGSLFLSASGGAVAEVVGNEEVLFDPDAPPTLTELLSRALHDPAFRDRQIAQGNERLNHFSWHTSAKIALKSLRETMAQQGRSESDRPETQPLPDQQRLIMDVSSTAQSPVLSGIQRVMYNLAEAVQTQDTEQEPQTVLSYCRGTDGWYKIPRLSKDKVSLCPTNRLNFGSQDTYFLLDSSWTFIEGQQVRLLDAMVMGQDVIHGIHDIGPLTMSAMTDAGMPPAFRRWFEFILGYSTGIVCVSRAVADEIYQLLKAIELPRPMKIGYFREGADFADVPAEPKNLDFVKERPTFLMVGTIEPRKGHYIALKAFEQLWAQGVDINLFIVGKAGWDTKLLQTLFNNHSEYGKRLHWRTRVSDQGLRAAYEMADALVMTSYLEGFGLPVVEAGRFGCPVILSDIPVFREVGKGAPWASYFECGNPADLAGVVQEFLDKMPPRGKLGDVDWPLWSQSAQELKEVLFGGNWYKYYEPPERLPNVKLTDIGNTRINAPLKTEENCRHTMRVVEGPFLSDDGTHLRTVVALRNESNVVWSSQPKKGGGLDVNLGYHLYDERGNCISYDNPRTQIPFVVIPNQEIYLPVRIETEWLTKGATRATLELVQEGVRWFGNTLEVNLLSPILSNTIDLNNASATIEDPALINIVMFRGPFGEDITNEHHYLFSVINGSLQPLRYLSEAGHPNLNISLTDGSEVSSAGVWPIAHYEEIAPNSFGILCVYATAKRVKETGTLQIELQQDDLKLSWLVDLATSEVTQTLVPPTQPSLPDSTADLWAKLNDSPLHETEITLPINSSSETEVITRGFHAKEPRHTWMRGTEAEIDLSGLLPAVILLREVELFCAPYSELSEPIELTLLIGGVKVRTQVMSRNFMSYTFAVPDEAAKTFLQSNHLQLMCSQALMEKGGERHLSICLGQIRLVYQTPKLDTEKMQVASAD